ncbi:WW domain binding protein 1-like [Scleropages formosus]|uniref:WW domain binding protein 1-like n=1 Tax=Scleropages formosus TaxID=113540 RepID=UPI0010FA6B29|nr:WW domain binding protein 1-like [Scleropages formosus]
MKGVLWPAMFLLLLYLTGATSPEVRDRATRENQMLCVGEQNQSYTCESGHCCGESECCSNYHQLWWFWLMWTIIVVLSCFCICQHRRTKARLQQQQRQHEINLIAYREVRSYASPPFRPQPLPDYLLPAYEEVARHPATPPPPYSARLPHADEPFSPLPRSQRATGRDLVPLGVSEDELLHQPDAGHEGRGKEQTAGRHRHFTGDSGIEVCGCSRDGSPLEPLVFCHGCQPCGSGDEERSLEPLRPEVAFYPFVAQDCSPDTQH